MNFPLMSLLKTFQYVYLHKAITNGPTATQKKPKYGGMMLRIHRKVYYFLDMMVKLTLNIDPSHGLGANSRGILKDLIFDQPLQQKKSLPYSQDHKLKYIIVDIPTYTGPPLSPHLPPTYCSFATFKCKSEKWNSHWRQGFPIIAAKADSIHGSQGLTVSETKPIKKMVLEGWSYKWESMWPGIFYVGVSRAAEQKCIILNSEIDQASLDSVGKSEKWKYQDTVCKNIEKKALEQRKQDLANGFGTPADLKDRLHTFISNMRGKTSHLPDSNVKTAILARLTEYEQDLNNFQLVRRSTRLRRPTRRMLDTS